MRGESELRSGPVPAGDHPEICATGPLRRRVLAAALLMAGAGVSAGALFSVGRARAATACPAFLDHTLPRLHSAEQVNLCRAFGARPLLIVNTASHCGFTPQFKGLQALHEQYGPRGLVVVGFASDDFHQEARTQAEAAEVCFLNFGVTFTMVAPSHVKGGQANPVFRELNRQAGEPGWNFNKYLVRADGRVLRRFDSSVQPGSVEMKRAIESLLG